MKYIFLFLASVVLSSFINSADAQNGCTDINATNYNASASANDGSCLYPTTYRTPLLKFSLISLLNESSGLCYTDGKLWSHDDSGNSAEIYSIDTSDGHLLQRIIVDNYPNTDWEEITADSLCLYVGDFGNNNGTRTDLKVLKIKKSDITTAAIVHVMAEAINFSYSDQTSFASSSTHNFDCEAMIPLNDSIYLFSKDRGDYKTRVYKLPKIAGTYSITPYTSFSVNGLITGASYNKLKKEIVLIGYQNNHAASFLWYLNDFSNNQFFSGNKRRIEIGNNTDWQTEGICWIDSNRLYLSNETSSAQVASLYQTDKLFQLNTTVMDTKKNVSSIYPNPTASKLIIETTIVGMTVYKILTSDSKVLNTWLSSENLQTIDLSCLISGNYYLSVIPLTNQQVEQVLKFMKL